MTSETARFLQKAENHLERGHIMLGVGLNEDAARASYLAAFHAAQALICERTGKVAKTHRGVQSEFFRLTKDDPHFTPDKRIFLSQAYNFKATADYETAPPTSRQNRQSRLSKERAASPMLFALY